MCPYSNILLSKSYENASKLCWYSDQLCIFWPFGVYNLRWPLDYLELGSHVCPFPNILMPKSHKNPSKCQYSNQSHQLCIFWPFWDNDLRWISQFPKSSLSIPKSCFSIPSFVQMYLQPIFFDLALMHQLNYMVKVPSLCQLRITLWNDLLLKGAQSYFSKFSFLFHLKNHHSKVVNIKLGLKRSTVCMYEANLCIAVAYILMC